MRGLNYYLHAKKDAIEARLARAAASDDPTFAIEASATVEGATGLRRIRIRDFQLISDSLPDYAGYDLGPASPELMLGALASCIAHTYLIRAAELATPLDTVSVSVGASMDLRTGTAAFPDVPAAPTGIHYFADIVPSERDADISGLHDLVYATCPLLNLLRVPTEVVRRIR